MTTSFMNTEATLRALEGERREWLRLYPYANRLRIARRIADMKSEPSDPFSHSRIVSRLVSGTATPDDFGFDRNAIVRQFGEKPVVRAA